MPDTMRGECIWCRQFRPGETPTIIEQEVIDGRVSHAMCPVCATIGQAQAKARKDAADAIMRCLLDAVKEAKALPCGTLYAMMMPYGCSLERYERMEASMIDTGLIEKRGHCLYWKGD